MNFRFFKITTIIISFIFLTGFLPILAWIGPAATLISSGNIYKASAQLIIDQSVKKKTGKNSLMLVKDELKKKENKKNLEKKLKQLVEKRIKMARQKLELQKINQ